MAAKLRFYSEAGFNSQDLVTKVLDLDTLEIQIPHLLNGILG